MNDQLKYVSAVALVTSGVAAAFALAACCAIPFMLSGLGITAAIFVPLVSATEPYADILSVFSALALLASVGIVWFAPRYCQPGSLCARPGFRWTVTSGAAVGAVLLVLGKIYK